MNGPYKTFEMFAGGTCRVCQGAVKGTANRNRHLDRHVRAGELEEAGDRGNRWRLTDAMPKAVDLAVRLHASLRRTPVPLRHVDEVLAEWRTYFREAGVGDDVGAKAIEALNNLVRQRGIGNDA